MLSLGGFHELLRHYMYNLSYCIYDLDLLDKHFLELFEGERINHEASKYFPDLTLNEYYVPGVLSGRW